MEISGVSAVVTGAGSGLGAAAARALAREGAKVALLDSNLEGARGVADEFGGLAAYCDVTDVAGAKAALAQAADRHGVPRILVNCAGISIGRVGLLGNDAGSRFTLFDKVMRINLHGTLNMLSLAAEQMATLDPLQHGERGAVIMTASVAAFDGQPGACAYAASKAGVAALALPAARELAGHGIRVNAIAPGYFETPLLSGLPQQVREKFADTLVFPKRLGTVDEFAQLVLHLAGNIMMNGETVRLDGAIRLPPA